MIWFIASASCWRFDKKLVCTEKSLMVESSGFRSGGLGDIATTPISGLFFQHFSLNSRQNKLKDLAKLKDFSLNSSIFLPKLKFSAILRYYFNY